jgi:hypothetical protein
MTKLIEIPFDASLIGQEGITVKYRNGETPDFVKYYPNSIVSIKTIGDNYTHYTNGHSHNYVSSSKTDLIMYREAKKMTVEEWFTANKYSDYKSILDILIRLAAAINNGEVEI